MNQERARTRRSAFTLIELLLALGLFSILVVALVRLLDTSLDLWERTEDGRELLEVGSSTLDLLTEDLNALDGGPRGDLVCEWVRFDTDKNGVADMLWPRVRLVRQASAADVARLLPAGEATALDPRALGLLEVVWALVPSGAEPLDARSMGTLVRGQRARGDAATPSFFDPAAIGAAGRPIAGSTLEVTGGVLWLDLWLATQTSVLHDGWSLGGGLEDCASSWDAWGRGRPDTEASGRNQPGAGMPAADDLPLLPRRVQVALEIERPADLKHRTRLALPLGASETSFEVADERRLPPPGTFLLVDEEWMELLAVSGATVSVKRAQRGSRATSHESGTLAHHGWRIVREVSVPLYREDWNL
jgi:prepilin-type N-terminal cleavage/methylation domain-containing protein